MKPNPFEVKADEITQASIHLCLAKEDTKAASSSSLPPLHPEITSSVLIDNGIELEEEQYIMFVLIEPWVACD
ncbi:hypothetical protein L210DRAFT_984724 [Boletus edulis BED1]|uniref:Uncharacterized protein n=1 Tax=Boletus edulis BED1 TaxID=1328754 RepID=A0AAD4BJA9_BOLED|nr:hypothetical protein L210DRAFT_984724 [Boletus edulis BED1]